MEYINLPSGRMAYLKKGSGRPILLVHGLGSSVLDWHAQIEYLSKIYLVYAIDLRGHGHSDKLKTPVAMADFATDVANFMCAMSMEPCPVIGISMGGMVTFQLMAQHPERVGSAVIINSAPYFPVDSLKIRLRILSRLFLLRFFGLKLLSRVIANNLFPASQEQFRRVAHQRIAVNDKASYLFSLKAVIGWSALSEVKQLNTPILVITGDRDYTPVSHKQKYVGQLRNAQLAVIKDSGHASPIDQPEQVNQLLRSFIEEHHRVSQDAQYSAAC
jgi:pimeloyl-ACP methyl ester carboxylesterase